MKLAKMFGLAMVAAIAAMAFVGASSASAGTVLCKENVHPCEAAKQYPIPTTIEATSNNAALTGSLPVVCTNNSVKGKTTGTEGTQLKGEIEVLKFASCSVFGFIPCTVTEIQLNYIAHLNQNLASLGNGHIYVGPGASGLQPGAFIKCGSTECEFKVNEEQPGHAGKVWAKLLVTGGNPATIKAENVALKSLINTGSCGTTATWNATYTVNTPKPVWVSHQP